MYLKDIAEAEEISEKYLSLIVIPLRQAGLIHSIRGAHGGYALAKAPSQINLGEIVEVLEGRGLVDCLIDPSACPRFAKCKSRDIWVFLDKKNPKLYARSLLRNGCPNWKENGGPTQNL